MMEVQEIKDWIEDGSNPTRSMVEFLLAEVDQLTGKLERMEAHWNDWVERCAVSDTKLRVVAQQLDEGKEREKILQDALELITNEGFRDKLLEHIASEALANAEKLRR